MLDCYDWLRRCRTGAELIATLRSFDVEPDLFLVQEQKQIGPPRSAFRGPCERCYIYPRAPKTQISDKPEDSDDPPNNLPDTGKEIGSKQGNYCQFCRAVLNRAWRYGKVSRHAVILWGFVNQFPPQFQDRVKLDKVNVLGEYFHDQHHFLIVLYKKNLMDWMREVVLYYGAELKGLLQIFPTVGEHSHTMGDFLVRAAHEEARYPLNHLRVRFYPASYHLLRPQMRERDGLLTFEISDFMSLLEMASVFRSMLRPESQEVLFALLNLKDSKEEMFYWGRFLWYLTPEAKDMLNAWGIRRWPRKRVKLLYELTAYVAFSPTH